MADDSPRDQAVAINGRGYQLVESGWQRQTMELIRQQADTSEDPGENSLNPGDLWRRAQDDWSLGAGQRWLDRPDSDRRRFRTSVGIDPWKEGELTLLTDVDQAVAATDAGQAVVAAGRVYIVRGDKLTYWDGSTTTDTSAFPSTILDITSDGETVYAAVDANGIHTVDGDSDTPTLLNDLQAELVEFVAGRLFAAKGPDLYEIDDFSTTTAPGSLGGLIAPTWRWDAIGQGLVGVYASGHSGNRSSVYRLEIRDDATGFKPPIEVAPMPDGERVRRIASYVGFVLFGTDRGVRVVAEAPQGLEYGEFIQTGAAVWDFEPHGRFVWFTWTDHPGGHPGLGRIDLSRRLPGERLVFAHASDLRARSLGSGTVRSVVSYDDRRAFIVENAGLYIANADGDLVPDGWLASGRFAHGLADKKVFHALEWAHRPDLTQSKKVRGQLFVDDANTATVDETIESGVDGGPFVADDGKGEFAEVIVTLERGTVAHEGPKFVRWLSRSMPVPRRSDVITLPLDLRSATAGLRGRLEPRNPEVEFDRLKTLEADGRPVTLRLLDREYTAFIAAVQRGPGLVRRQRRDGWEGQAEVTLRIFDV